MVAVVNASETYGLAARAADVLGRNGFTIEEIRDRKDGEALATVVDYGAGADADALALADILGIPSPPKANPNLPDGKIRVILSPGYEIPGSESDPAASDPTSIEVIGTPITVVPDAGTPIDGGNGVPCVN